MRFISSVGRIILYDIYILTKKYMSIDIFDYFRKHNNIPELIKKKNVVQWILIFID